MLVDDPRVTEMLRTNLGEHVGVAFEIFGALSPTPAGDGVGVTRSWDPDSREAPSLFHWSALTSTMLNLRTEEFIVSLVADRATTEQTSGGDQAAAAAAAAAAATAAATAAESGGAEAGKVSLWHTLLAWMHAAPVYETLVSLLAKALGGGDSDGEAAADTLMDALTQSDALPAAVLSNLNR
jgi:hypothetical protein